MKHKPQEILSRLVAAGASGRKLRLFACACWRRVRRDGLWARLHRAVETAERYADGLAGRKDLLDAKSAAWDLATRLARLVPSLSRLQPRDVLLAAYATEETTPGLAERLLDAVAWQEVAA